MEEMSNEESIKSTRMKIQKSIGLFQENFKNKKIDCSLLEEMRKSLKEYFS